MNEKTQIFMYHKDRYEKYKNASRLEEKKGRISKYKHVR